MADLSTWLTKKQVAARLKVSEKTVDRYHQAKKLKSKIRHVLGQRAELVFDPETVHQLVEERSDAPPVEQAEQPSSESALVPVLSPVGQLRANPLEFLAALAQGRAPEPPRMPESMFLTIKEAAIYTGLPLSEIRKLIDLKEISARKTGAGWRIRRTSLDVLTDEQLNRLT